MDTNTTSSKLFVLFVQGYDESENNVDHLGIFPTFKAAVKFRTKWICTNYDMDDPNLEESFKEEFEQNFFGGKVDAPWLDNGHSYFVIEEVPSFV